MFSGGKGESSTRCNRNVDLIAGGYDLAIRLGPLPDSGLIEHKLEDAPLCVVAAPDYLRRAGALLSVDELAEHARLPFVTPSTGRVSPWLFCEQGIDRDVGNRAGNVDVCSCSRRWAFLPWVYGIDLGVFLV